MIQFEKIFQKILLFTQNSYFYDTLLDILVSGHFIDRSYED